MTGRWNVKLIDGDDCLAVKPEALVPEGVLDLGDSPVQLEAEAAASRLCVVLELGSQCVVPIGVHLLRRRKALLCGED